VSGGPLVRLGAFGAALVLGVVCLAGAAGAGVASLLGGGEAAPSTAATGSVPAAMLALYQEAAASCPGLPWTVLAAIGTVESDNGQSSLPGVQSGANAAGAEGDLQELPATFAEYDEPVPPGGANPPSPYDPTDAVYVAARLLCANGARDGADLDGAVFAFNHSEAYVSEVMDLAQSYSQTNAEVVAAGTAPGVALDWALAQVGTPYVWGGETPGVGFDCSGLVQAAYAAAGVTLPRTAQAQYDGTTKLGPGDPLMPGDLVFFGGGPDDVEHVGIYVGMEDGEAVMVDAPETGADVRVEAFPTTVGASFGQMEYLGASWPVP
jgi:cell wall-associated NlpC family hydrolase